MRRLLTLLYSLRRSNCGVAAVEFCLTLPALLLMTAVAYDVSRLISTRMDYQQALTEGAGLAIAQPPQGSNFGYIVNAVAAAAGVSPSNVAVTRQLRCNGTVVAAVSCPSTSDERAWFVSITVNGSYVPFWTHFTMKESTPITITRTVRVQ